jgi:hypothetical protein
LIKLALTDKGTDLLRQINHRNPQRAEGRPDGGSCGAQRILKQLCRAL